MPQGFQSCISFMNRISVSKVMVIQKQAFPPTILYSTKKGWCSWVKDLAAPMGILGGIFNAKWGTFFFVFFCFFLYFDIF